MSTSGPALVVLSSLYPSDEEPLAGLFIRERMFRVGRELPITVVSPQPWFPLQGLIRCWRPGYRATKSRRQKLDTFDVYRPRFPSVPGFLRHLDGLAMALACWPLLRRLKSKGRAEVIDAHFGYPDGYAASLLGRWLRLPFTVTLRGTEPRHLGDQRLRGRIQAGLRRADRVFSVSASLRDVAVNLGVDTARTRVIGNGVDLNNFRPIDRSIARQMLSLPTDARVVVSVGALVERKGFHRVIELLPDLLRMYPSLHYVVVGGSSPEGDWTARLKGQVESLGIEERVHFLGPVRPEKLHVPLSAADVFALASSNEGWANVLLEAMACGLPVVTTRVGGNAEVVCSDTLGIIVPFGDSGALKAALASALNRQWDRTAIRRYAENNAWDRRIEILVDEFRLVASGASRSHRSELAQRA